VLVDEGDGRCRARMGDTDMLGNVYRHGDHVALCLRSAAIFTGRKFDAAGAWRMGAAPTPRASCPACSYTPAGDGPRPVGRTFFCCIGPLLGYIHLEPAAIVPTLLGGGMGH
jgi:hypothetical protein